ncbi:MAG: DNA repair protein RecN [Holophagales bacterium]|nr:DNA repair protein RecN [Holophagales bacterium]MYG31415.1 DNA repair protein RecN [Holophagales bacterium]MYI81348.1 DNA repair protein RecN [Holophagales bacterium]
MLRSLHVRNLAVIERAELEFGPGLNVVTGETGAGKSLVVDSLSLLAGGRASSEVIRTGAGTLAVSGVFEPSGAAWRGQLEEAGVPVDGDELLVRREVTREGRNRVFVNDHPVTARLLSTVAHGLIRIFGQRDELGMLSADLQRAWLDRSGGDSLAALVDSCREAWGAYREAADRLERLSLDDQLRQERIDLLKFQTSEIDAARLLPGEDEELRAEREVLRHAEAIAGALHRAIALLSEDEMAVDGRVAQAGNALSDISRWQPEAESWVETLAGVGATVNDLAQELRTRVAGCESDPARLNQIEERLSVIERLARKHGGSSSDVLEHGRRLSEELLELETADVRREEVEQEAAARLAEYAGRAETLSAARRERAGALEREVVGHLLDLAFERAAFEVEITRELRDGSPLELDGERVAFDAQGVDRVTYRFSANPGEDLRPLSRVASGGELARLFLALQTAVRGGGPAEGSTLVFDEVDSGVGGAEAAIVGRKLQRLASGGQILAVTHLPQVASRGNLHLEVKKEVHAGRTRVDVHRLDHEHRIEEVARMLAGEHVTDASRSAAAELLAAGAE